ncbi:Zinc finger, RING/FYVE/PHD-type [Cordyceps fumosorosea ARSEF 2679]|uniref:RING-type E3 ubiquitin transferase n=1 Tax=Cordyceps fumosorosea (strain ARSEF 2679) TaxID=1081104 RepID=A0A167S6N1_CORFA|nr:Zinc finger, RING/FYVE/PHD-type [Cordyceps fumosorosea ARSEF 2679]OAA59311.1 Zinc finger, RING/FYVE/PHD-type [Cordyceps fumosorosea ARSEF 2679]
MVRSGRATALAALACSAVYSAAAASDGISTTSPQTDTPDWLANESLSLTLVNSATPGLQYPVLPSTSNMGLNESANIGRTMNIQGDITLVDQNNYYQLSGLRHIAYLCCDNADKQDNFNISPNKMLNQLMGANLSAIILYSATTNWCSFSPNNGPSYSSIVTMADKGDAADVLAHITGKPSNQTLFVSIKGNTTATPDPAGDDRGHSTVAMSVLYSITGLITLLFLAIIITGTVRAHRHPERYGPHNGFGRRPRQSRAKGIARAVLETLPIVKFGNDDHAKPDPELELEPTVTQNGEHAANAVAAGGLGSGAPESTAKKGTAKENDERSGESSGPNTDADAGQTHTQETGIAEPASAQDSSDHGDDQLGCSICTEDFNVGEDVRVLPCNHQFHPGCVDPWLVNVSGTCPLCRYDLQPGRHAGALAADPSLELPPPLALEAEDNESTASSSRHRASRLFDLHRLRHVSPQERIAALREMRRRHDAPHDEDGEAHGEAPSDGAEQGEESGRATRLAAKLRDKFRIRTRAQT